MPQVKTVESLLNLGLKCVEAIIHYNKFSLRSISQLDSIFVRQLPAHLLEKITQRLLENGAFREKNKSIWYLFTPLLRDAKIYGSLHELFFSVGPRCYTRMENLITLKIVTNDVGNSTLKSIGKYCKQLRELDLGCTEVTDAGILMLCFGAKYEDEGTRKHTKLCGTLQLLNLNFTQLSKNAIQVALSNLVALRVFVNALTFDVLAESAQNSFLKTSNFPKYSLVRLATREYGQKYLSGSLRLALSLCPFVSQLSICLKNGIKDSDILSLMSLKTIRSLRIYRKGLDWAEEQITFEGGLAPLLKVIGSSLEILELSCFHTFNIWTVVEFCPNLCSLLIDKYFYCRRKSQIRLEEEGKYPYKIERWKKKHLILKELKYLHCCFNFPPDVLLFLLSSPSLVSIRIENCDMLTDDVFRDAAELHQFQKLKSLELHRCNAITKHGIDVLMTHDNPLNNLGLFYCKKLTYNNSIKEWEFISRTNNWNLQTFAIN